MDCGLLEDLHSGEELRKQAEDSRITFSPLHFPSISMAIEEGRAIRGHTGMLCPGSQGG